MQKEHNRVAAILALNCDPLRDAADLDEHLFGNSL
jgi:hypothetical protein